MPKIEVSITDSISGYIKKAKERLGKQFEKMKWENTNVKEFDILLLSSFAFRNQQFDLVYPGFIYLMEDSESDTITIDMCGVCFVPIGSCGNGDLIVVCAKKDERQTIKKGAVYFISMELFGVEKELSNYVRFIADSLTVFVSNFPKAGFPSDCYEESKVSPRLRYRFDK